MFVAVAPGCRGVPQAPLHEKGAMYALFCTFISLLSSCASLAGKTCQGAPPCYAGECSGALPLIFLLIGLWFASSASAATTLKIATLSPEGTGWMIELRKAAKAIRERTADEVKLKIYPGGVMGDDKAVLRKLRVGQLHGAAMTSGVA